MTGSGIELIVGKKNTRENVFQTQKRKEKERVKCLSGFIIKILRVGQLELRDPFCHLLFTKFMIICVGKHEPIG